MAIKNKEKVIDVVEIKDKKNKHSSDNNSNSNKTNKFVSFWKDLGKSLISTEYLFKFGIKHWITPLIVFLTITTLIVIPPYLQNNNLSGDEVLTYTGVYYADDALSYALSTDVKCKIVDNHLSCDEGYKLVAKEMEFENDYGKKVEYDIFINADEEIAALDDQAYFKIEKFPDAGDNYIALYKESFIMRYVYRNDDTGDYATYKTYGFYTELNGLDLHQVYTEAISLEETTKNEKFDTIADEIIAKGFKVSNAEMNFIKLTSNLFSYLLLVAIAAVLIKGNYLLNRHKGFKYSQCIKVTIIASIQSYVIGFIFSLFRFNLVNVFGLALTFRVLYIWFRYTASRKNTQWLENLYKLTNDERFKLEVNQAK